ncbi:MAG: hypothetical protein D6756_02955 [Cyanobacteria bacterium J083]|nr:MAG: hypothetical protein D6756_02955 [Cyanobacteria bacterium J083]
MGIENLVKKAFYMGVGIASYATEKAGTTLSELRIQAEKLADEMVERGEITAEEARKLVDDMIKQAQQQTVESSTETESNQVPRRIEIIEEGEESSSTSREKSAQTQENVDDLRKQVELLKQELRNLKQN